MINLIFSRVMKNLLLKYSILSKCFLPLLLFLGYFFLSSLEFPLHDFSNSYFPAHILANTNESDVILFDIYKYNNYIWNLGYDDVLADFYLNSPFNTIAFYPFIFIQDVYLAKAIFNVFSIILFLLALYGLLKKYGENIRWLVIALPILFYVPFRNQILFGQTYFLVFALVVFGFLWIEKRQYSIGSGALIIALFLKIFPIAYGIPLIFKREWKAVFFGIFISFIILGLSIWFTGIDLWKTYFFEVLPNAIKNKSTVNFQFNAQSLEVFLKTLFVQDDYYNPTVLFDNNRMYFIIKCILKSIIVGVALSLSFSNKKNLFALLSIWVVTLFLMQSRTASYAQLLWIIPAFYMSNSTVVLSKKIGFFIILLLLCNIPLSILEDLPIFFKFSRLWLMIGLSILFYSSFNRKVNYKYIVIGLFILLPLHLDMFFKEKVDASTYVLDHHSYFMIHDFEIEENRLIYKALGKGGEAIEKTTIVITKFDELTCVIKDNQIQYNGLQITNDASIKKKPVLVNDCEVYYLTDANSRRGAFTLKKINICD